MKDFEIPDLRELFMPGALFHRTKRHPVRSPERVDRLQEILKRGIIAPFYDLERKAVSDINISVAGTETRYDQWVYLHRIGLASHLYTGSSSGSVLFLVDRNIDIKEPDQMEEHWPVLCQDEVYVQGMVPPEAIEAVIIRDKEAVKVREDFDSLLRKGEIALKGFSGKTF